MGLCSGYGFLHAIERGQRNITGGILQTLINRSTTMGVMGQGPVSRKAR